MSSFLSSVAHVDIAVKDLLSLYTHHRASCSIDAHIQQNIDFLSIQIVLQREKDDSKRSNVYSATRHGHVIKDANDEKLANVSKIGEKEVVRFFLDSDHRRRDYEAAQMITELPDVRIE